MPSATLAPGFCDSKQRLEPTEPQRISGVLCWRQQPHPTFTVSPQPPTACLDGKWVIRHNKTRNPHPREMDHPPTTLDAAGWDFSSHFDTVRWGFVIYLILSLLHLLLSHSPFLPGLQKHTILQVSSNSKLVERNGLQSICLPAGSHCQLRQQQVPERWMGQLPQGKKDSQRSLQNNVGNPLFVDPLEGPGLRALSKMCHCSGLTDFGAGWQLQFQFW